MDIILGMNPARVVDWIESHGPPAAVLAIALAVVIADLLWSLLDRASPDENGDRVRKQSRRRRTRVWTGGTAGTIAFTVLLIWGPWWIEGHHLKDGEGNLVSSAGILVTGFRTMLVALAAGAFTAAGLYFTREKHRLEREQFQHAQELFAENQKQFETTLRETQQRDQRQVELTREGQVTGRYVEAIKLLASPTDLHERLGGIYALERIMKDSERDRNTVVEVLAAFVRTRLDEGAAGQQPTAPLASGDASAVVGIALVAEDTRAALEVLGRNWKPEHSRADLRSIDIRGWDARELNFTGARLTGVHLPGARLEGARLDDADLYGAHLVHAHLVESQLQRARLAHANLSGAKLKNARLQGADLFHATLESADLTGATLGEADLRYVQGLTADQLRKAHISNSTQLPEVLAQDPLVQASIRAHEEALDAVSRAVESVKVRQSRAD
jgi:hypothetical protein